MSRRVLLVRGNPRKNGMTQRLTDLVSEGLREVGAQVTDVDLATTPLQLCEGCFHCWLGTPGQCVHGDAMGPLLEEVLRADTLLCATPVYYFSMSALLKTFFERTFPLAQPGLTTSRSGWTRNSIRFGERWSGKTLITLVAGALRGEEPFRPVNDTFRWIADSLDLELGGQLTRPEAYLIDYPLSKPKTVKRIIAAYVQAGKEAGTTGRLTAETIEAAVLPLSFDEEHFRTYSNLYWEHAQALGSEGADPARVRELVARDVRILIREMVRSFDSRAAGRLRATLQFEFSDPEYRAWVRIDGERCEWGEGVVAEPDLRVCTRAAVWAGMFMRQTNVREALVRRELELHGDKSLFPRLERLFPPPST